MLDDIGATDDQIAKFLDLAPRTIRKYRRDGQAPRAVMLALFWETSWGENWRQTRAENGTMLAKMEVQLLKHRNTRLVKQILTMEAALKDQKKGAANSPLFQIG